MAFSYNEVVAGTGQTLVTLTFPFLDRTHVKVSVDRVDLPGSAWVWVSDASVELNEPLIGGETLRVYRETPAEGVQADFGPGAFDYQELNTSLLHLLYIVQEAYDNASVAVEAGNNAFAYLMQIEELADDAEAIFADMQALGVVFDDTVTAALTAIASVQSAALSDLASSRSTALSDIASARSSVLDAITTQQTASVSAVGTAQTTAVTAINALITDATTLRNQAQGYRNEAQGFRNEAETFKNQAATSVTGAVKANEAQSFTTSQKGQALANIDGGVLAGLRNKLINGDILVAQRGTVFTVPAGGAQYTADRWVVANNTNQPATVTVFARSFGSFSGQGHPGYIGVSFGVAPTTGTVELRQPIEGVQTLAGKTVTFGARAARSAGSLSVSGFLYQNFGTGGAPSPQVTTPVTFSSPSAGVSGVDLKGVVPLPSVSGKTRGNNNNDYLSCSFSFAPRDVAATYFSHAYIVEGDATAEADPFSPRHIQQELALCQRYYETGHWIVYGGAPYGGANFNSQQFYKATKRAGATVSFATNTSTNATVGLDYGQIGSFNMVATSVASGQVSAYGTWTSDAEI